MNRRTGRGPVSAKTIKSGKKVKKELPSGKTILLIAAVLITITIIFFSRGSKEKVIQPSPTPTIENSVQIRADADKTPGESIKQPQTIISADPSSSSIRQIRITPEIPKIGDTVKISFEGIAGDGNQPKINYEWRKNGEKLDVDSNLLLITPDFRRGDKIDITMTHEDERGRKNSWHGKLTIANSPPEIVSATDLTKSDVNKFSFQVKAKDADGDVLKYSLKSSIDGSIDPATGKVVFTVPEGKKGKVPVLVSVTDDNGGEATYSFEMTLDVGKQQAK